MKIRFSSLCRTLLLLAVMLPLANCATSSKAPAPGGAAYVQPAPEPSGGTSAVMPVAPAAAEESGNADGYVSSGPGSGQQIVKGRRFGQDAVSSRMIDQLVEEGSDKKRDRSPGSQNRPGLATQAGDERWNRMTQAPFYRKATGTPDAVDSFYYNDETGAKGMADALGGTRRKSGNFEAAGGRLEVALCQGFGGGAPLDRYEAADRRIVVGTGGARYQIFLKNRTRRNMEVVASVDGLDVVDGKAAATSKRGYVVPAKGELTIAGFRINSENVREFIFGNVDSSAAAKAGMARNVGVIGLAVYEEDAAQAKLASLVESQKRGAATPFPVGAR